MVHVIFLGMLVDIGVVRGLLKHKVGQLQDKGALKKKGLEFHDKLKGKNMVIEAFAFDQSMKDLPKHLPIIRPNFKISLIF